MTSSGAFTLSCNPFRASGNHHRMEKAGIVSRGLTRLVIVALVCVIALYWASEACAHGVTFKIHHYLPADSPFHIQFLLPWKEKLERESDGHLRIQIYPAMQLGGSPSQLYDQVRDRTADIVWTLVDNDARRFPAFEVFNLPLMTNTARGANRALWEYVQIHNLAKREFAGVRLLAVHVSTVRSRENSETVSAGDSKSALLNDVFIFAMNSDVYKNLPDELKKVVGTNSGAGTSVWLGKVLEENQAEPVGHAGDDSALRHRHAENTIEDRIKELDQRGLDGKGLVESARALLAEHDSPD
jgi:TRAP-type C4-dicarboxylate transport system substrate-binding protein